jgi:hypothetical protein
MHIARTATLAIATLCSALVATPRATLAQAVATPLPITFFGEVRTRSELDQPAGPLPSDVYTYLRSRFGVRVDATPHARVVLQMQDSRVLGAEGSPAAAAVEQFDLHQGYVELGAPWRGVAAAARAGRQEIALGNERLVGSVGWSNVGRSFDGVRLLFSPEGAKAGSEPWTATMFGATVEERGRHYSTTTTMARPTSGDHAVAGLYATRALAGSAVLSATLLHDAGADYRVYRDARRTTLDARLVAPRLLGARLELEGALQRGSQRYAADTMNVVSQDVSAWLVGARLGTAVAPTTRASVALGIDALSGDATPGDGRYGAFATMYATNHPFYGVMDVIGDPATTTKDRGLMDALATGALALSKSVDVKAELHRFTLAAGDTRDLGWEADLTLPVRITSTTGIDLGVSAFRAGDAAAAVGLGASGATRGWAYLQLRAGF